jgi:hypothetical protein
MTKTATCRHCERPIEYHTDDGWVDPEATDDDEIWRQSCDAHDTFTAEHEPEGYVTRTVRISAMVWAEVIDDPDERKRWDDTLDILRTAIGHIIHDNTEHFTGVTVNVSI